MRAFKLMAVIGLLFLAACGGRRNAGEFETRETNVRVNNQAWLDVNLYVLDGARRVRLGTVPSTTTRTLRIPESVVGLGRPLRFQADPVGSSNVASSFEIMVSPGRTVQLTIPNTIGR